MQSTPGMQKSYSLLFDINILSFCPLTEEQFHLNVVSRPCFVNNKLIGQNLVKVLLSCFFGIRTLTSQSLWIFPQIPAHSSKTSHLVFFTWILEAWKLLLLPLRIAQGRCAKCRSYSDLFMVGTTKQASKKAIVLWHSQQGKLVMTSWKRVQWTTKGEESPA